LLRLKDGKAAVEAAQAALTAIPNDAQLVEALGAAQVATDPKQAVDTLRHAAELQPQNPLAYLRLAEVQTLVKDYESALISERKALALKPDLPQAYGALAKTYIAFGQHDQAIAEARKLQKQYADKAIGYALEGEILAAQKKWPQAADAFKTALARQQLPILATRTYALLIAAGKTSDAAAFARKWISDHPNDSTMPLALAQFDMQRKDFKAARTGYERVLKQDPDNAIALNNLAWILIDAGDAKGLEYAEQAHRLAPFSPNVLDTLGWALTRNGQAKRGVQLLRMAAALAPTQSQIRLHYAKALLETGDTAGGRRELTTLSKLNAASPVRVEAEKLLGTP
jgi:putative PEP-CTERM system TPR-repeat lipoprotein